MTFKDLEKILKKDGWYYYDTVGSHMQYKHEIKQGKITIPKHRGDIKKRNFECNIKTSRIKR